MPPFNGVDGLGRDTTARETGRRGEGGGPRGNAGRVVPRGCYNSRLLLEGQPLSFGVLSRSSRRDGLFSFRPLAGFGCVTSAFGWASTPSAMSKRAGLVRSLWGSRLNRNGRGGWTCVPLDRIRLHGDTRCSVSERSPGCLRDDAIGFRESGEAA